MKNTKVTIIIPTYNERDNLKELVRRVNNSLRSNYEILFVDDSTDETPNIIRQLEAEYPIRFIHRDNERGLATAVVTGIKNSDSPFLIVMDADLQHPPEDLPKILTELESHDIVIGKREEIEDWSLIRRSISKGATLLAKIMLPSSRRISDPMSGLFGFRKEVTKNVTFNPKGYKILLEIIEKGSYKTTGEVPYAFGQRYKGESKLDGKEYVNFLKHLLLLFLTRNKRIIKFCTVGLSGVFVNIGLLYVLTEVFKLYYLVSACISVETSILTNFAINDLWTFRDRRRRNSFMNRMLKFNAVSIFGLLINLTVLYALTEIVGIYYIISNLFGIAIATAWNYMINLKWTYNTKTGEKANV